MNRSRSNMRCPRPITWGCIVRVRTPSGCLLGHVIEFARPNLEHLGRRREANAHRLKAEGEVRPVVQGVVHRELPEPDFLPALQRLIQPHPVPQTGMVGVKIVGEQAGIVDETVFHQQREGCIAVVPGWRAIPGRRLPCQAFKHSDALLQIATLLVCAQRAGITMPIAVMGDFVPGAQDRFDRLRIRFGRMARHKEGRRKLIG